MNHASSSSLLILSCIGTHQAATTCQYNYTEVRITTCVTCPLCSLHVISFWECRLGLCFLFTSVLNSCTDHPSIIYYFECRRQGHLACNCPNKKQTNACTVQIQENNDLIDLSDAASAFPSPPIPLPSNLTYSLTT